MRKTTYAASGPTIIAQAPCRADLAGGTIDLWPLYLFHPGALTVNFAVNILTTCRITPLKGKRIHLRSIDTQREEEFSSFEALRSASRFRLPLAARLLQFFAPKEGLLIETDSESPAGAGISGSSALMIASTAALARFTDRHLTLEQMRVIAQNVEAQIIQVPTGCQDYYPALYGGASAIHLDADGIHREAVTIAPEEIESRFVLAYTGAPRKSGINNWEVFKAHINGDKRVFRNFERIVEIARAMHAALAEREMGRGRPPASRRVEAAPHQCAGNHHSADRQADQSSGAARRTRGQSLRRRRRRMRNFPGGRRSGQPGRNRHRRQRGTGSSAAGRPQRITRLDSLNQPGGNNRPRLSGRSAAPQGLVIGKSVELVLDSDNRGQLSPRIGPRGFPSGPN